MERKKRQMLTESQPKTFGRSLHSSSINAHVPAFHVPAWSGEGSHSPVHQLKTLDPKTPLAVSSTLLHNREVIESTHNSSIVHSGLNSYARTERESPACMDYGNRYHSTRKSRVSMDNVTQRDSKRPSERPKDKEYHRRFSTGVQATYAHSAPPAPMGGHSWPDANSTSRPGRTVMAVEFGHSSDPPVPPTNTGRGRTVRSSQ
jgi:hypothetical protein